MFVPFGIHEFIVNDYTSLNINVDSTLHPKRRRTTSTKAWDVESEQEEHSLSLSQHSSPSHSDQEQTPNPRIVDSAPGSQGFNLFKKKIQSPRNSQSPNALSNCKDLRNSVQKSPNLNLLGDHQTEQKREQHPHVSTGRPIMQYPAVEQKTYEAVPVQNLVCISLTSPSFVWWQFDIIATLLFVMIQLFIGSLSP